MMIFTWHEAVMSAVRVASQMTRGCKCVSILYRTDEVMLVKLSGVWTLVSFSAFIIVSQCIAAPTSQRQHDVKPAADVADADAHPPLVRSTQNLLIFTPSLHVYLLKTFFLFRVGLLAYTAHYGLFSALMRYIN